MQQHDTNQLVNHIAKNKKGSQGERIIEDNKKSWYDKEEKEIRKQLKK